MSGTIAHPEGITNPPIDDLLAAADGSKYGLVIYAAKRARQINAYYSLLSEGQLENVGPLVETHVQEKPLSVALREIDAGLLTVEPYDPAAVADPASGYGTEFGAEIGTDFGQGYDGTFDVMGDPSFTLEPAQDGNGAAEGDGPLA